jgi:hypothetical protein
MGKAVPGFNVLERLYHVRYISIPMTFELIRKPFEHCDLNTRKRKRAGGPKRIDMFHYGCLHEQQAI